MNRARDPPLTLPLRGNYIGKAGRNTVRSSLPDFTLIGATCRCRPCGAKNPKIRPTVMNLTRRMAIANGTCVSFCNQPGTFCLLGYAPGTIPVNVKWMERGFNVGQTHSSTYPSIYLQPFMSYSEILVGNCNFFIPPCIKRPRWGCSHWNSGRKCGPQKTRFMGLPSSEDSMTIYS